MSPDLSLHHCAKRITSGHLDFVLKLFEQLGCRVAYREQGATWAIVEQEGLSFRLQFIECDQVSESTNHKRDSHIAFLSSDPSGEVERMRQWVEAEGKQFVAGSWSDKEFYFDCPDVFVDFVVEIMHRSIVE